MKITLDLDKNTIEKLEELAKLKDVSLEEAVKIVVQNWTSRQLLDTKHAQIAAENTKRNYP